MPVAVMTLFNVKDPDLQGDVTELLAPILKKGDCTRRLLKKHLDAATRSSKQ